MEKTVTTIRLSLECRKLMEGLKEQRGINGTSLIETLIREAAAREGVKVPKPSRKSS